MIYYADYEALEFDSKSAKDCGLFPYYLKDDIADTALCPIYFSACTRSGDIVCKQNAYDVPISFMRFLDREITRHNATENKIMFVWFHNIQYDFRIILYELFHNGFTNIVDSEQMTYIGNYRTEKENAFSIVGKNLSKYIGVNIYYRGWKILIRDTMSILNSSQNKILKEFGFEEKIDVEWNKITLENLPEHMPLIEHRNIYDVQSLSKAIETFKDIFYTRFAGRGTTAASMSLDALRHYLCALNGIEKPNRDDKEDTFREYYPMLEGDIKDISAGCYHGGICTINKKYAGQVVEDLQAVDINSSYPYSMTLPLPYGEGTEIRDFQKEGYSEYVVYIEFKHKGIPFQRCHSENKARYLLGLEPNETTYSRSQFPEKFEGYLCINSIDLATLKKHAKVKILEFKRGVTYKTNTLLKDFIVPIYEQRKQSKGVVKLAIKLLLNSLYGKYAQDLSGVIFQYDSVEDYERIRAIDNDTYYKPFASAVTAYARMNWINTVYLLGDDFLYGDTDSIYYKNISRCNTILEEAGVLDEDDLGRWKMEYIAIHKGKFLSKKNYIIDCTYYDKDKKENVRKVKVTCVGLSHKYHNQVNFDNFIIGSEEFNIEKMINIYGGKAMRPTKFKIKERNL